MVFFVSFSVFFFKHLADSYGLENDDFNAEELEEAVDIQDTLEADNYEDQLPQPEVLHTTIAI